MKAHLFYQEFFDETKTHPTGNVVVVFPGTEHRIDDRMVSEGLGRISPNILQSETAIAPNQLVTNWKVDPVWLQQYCLQVSEQQARKIHPRLFESCMDAEIQEQRKVTRQRAVWVVASFGVLTASRVAWGLANRNNR